LAQTYRYIFQASAYLETLIFQTKVTLITFLAWKKKKLQDKKDSDAKEEEKKRNDYKSGKQNGLSGRDMFRYDKVWNIY
jgi:DRG Family Regulatory Proteins, Tma46